MEPLVELFRQSGVQAHFSGHEHNFQHSHADGIDYFVTGAGSKIRAGVPNGFEQAHTHSWSGACHFLLVTVDDGRMTVRAIGESPGRRLEDIPRLAPSGEAVQGPIVIERAGREGA
jgi:hypothetical protein